MRAMYIPTFQQIAVKENLTLSVAAAPLCPWQRDLSYLTTGIDSCRASHADWYGGLIDRLDPDIIVVVDRPIDDPVNSPPIVTPNGDEQPGSPQFENALTSLSAASLDQLRAVGRTIVIIEPIPIPAAADDPLECLSSATSLDQCAYQATPGPTPLEAFYRRAAQATDVRSIDFDRLVCPRLPTCDPVVDGLIVKANSSHLTGTFAAHLATQVDTLLRGAGVLP